MGKIATFSTPLLFQSKPLCCSLLFLTSSLLLAAHFTFSATKCLFRSSPSTLFRAPSSPTLPPTPSTSTPSPPPAPPAPPPSPSPIERRWRIAKGVVVSAIFNDHDKIRQPVGLGSKTLGLVCFFLFVDDETLDRLHLHNLITPQKSSKKLKIGAWTVVRVSSEELYENPAMNGVIPKYLLHRLFPNSKYSIWIDAKLQLVVDPLLLIHSLVIKDGFDMAVSKHPFFLHTMEEAAATARWRKWWDVSGIIAQMESYCEHGLLPWNSDKPYPSDVPDSALILRKHSVPTNLFSCLIFNELEGFNPRDQLPFAFVRDNMRPKLRLNMFEVEVFEQIAIEYRHNTKNQHGGGGANVMGSRNWGYNSALFANGTHGKCEGYLLDMWGEVESP
ncbi:hypothetical protein SASPL_157384 [Salvia splendens]|uniref:TOD1/MUCI70 glycosyltransferase-like domain-containing protein n=1 Tax=Salvia splendens TaxID=180675 RepID=A0A8X8VV20_SALSN|nr:hypothetical protein SASPL_157384 [Salvia splendens]